MIVGTTVFAAGALQPQVFYRRAMFARAAAHAALINDAASATVQLIGMLVCIAVGMLSATLALLVIAAGAITAAATGCLQLRRLLPLHVASRLGDHASHRHFGFPLAIAHVADFGYAQANTFLLAQMLSTAATGAFGATRVVMQPLYVFWTGISSMAVPDLSRTLQLHGRRHFAAKLASLALALVGATVLYCAVVVTWAEWILTTLYGTAYADQVPTLVTWSAVYLFTTFGAVATAGLLAVRKPVVKMWAHIAAATTTLPLSLFLIPAFGTVGAVGAIAVGAFVLASILLIHLIQTIRLSQGGPSA
jgi:O-antigen/teichoic acid export membrane protein